MTKRSAFRRTRDDTDVVGHVVILTNDLAPVRLGEDRTPFLVRYSDRGETMSESVQQQIVREVSSWPDVTIAEHRFGGIEFRLGRRELGHLHGNRLADLPFPVRVREQLVAAGRASPHHVLPQSGWVSYRIRDVRDVAHVVALFRLNYERPWR